MCLSALAGKQFEYPIAFDIEEQASLQNADALCQAFCGALESAGYYAAIYTFKSALESCIGDNVKKRYDVFLSHVDVSRSSYAGHYGLWQYSWKGSVSGIVGEVDLDYAYQDYPAIIKNVGLNGFQKMQQPLRRRILEKTLWTLGRTLICWGRSCSTLPALMRN